MHFVVALCLCLLGPIWAATTFSVRATKDTYPLNWETIYRVNICNGYSTVFEPPQGYVLKDVILGNSKLFQAQQTGDRAIIKRLAPDNASSNLILILETPEKATRSLTFELTGEDAPRISNVQFMAPEQRGRDQALEAARKLYNTQLQMTLMDQERRLSNTIRERTMEKMETFQLEGHPSEEKLGVKITVEAVLNNGGKGYVYIGTNSTDPDYQIVQMTGIQGKDIAKTVTLFRTQRNEKGTRYIYETTPFVKCADCQKYDFLFRVYRETTQIKAKVR